MVATPPEEIARQHEEAKELVEQGMPCAVVHDQGEIPLTWKQHPTEAVSVSAQEEKKDDDAESCPSVSSRGYVDIRLLQTLVREGYDERAHPTTTTTTSTSTEKSTSVSTTNTNLWDPTNAAKNNVTIERPSHDAWGIKKIILLFCDDFLQHVYEMPWWHSRPDVRVAVQPILNALNVEPTRVVRLLLAALPPEVTIPIHHDTGEWVRHSHRVHCPIIVTDPSKILFRCGLTTKTMQRVDCTPGHVFEMNNQARHAVSNCGEDHRVHLILDYVDATFNLQTRIPVVAGERLLQTRRSIDRVVDKGTRPTPSFMILGTQKAGTTSLYEYIMQHPLVVRPKRRETHCLDWRWNDNLSTTQDRRAHCSRFYYAQELQFHPSCMTGDSTPSYLLDSLRIIPRLKQVFPWRMKFMVMLRDPVQRAHSHYAMVTSKDGTPAQIKARGIEWHSLTFGDVVWQDLHKMQDCGLLPYWNIERGELDQDSFDAFVSSEEEKKAWYVYLQQIPLNTGSHSPVSRGLYELNLRPWFASFDKEDFLILNLDDMKQNVQCTVQKVWQHLQLPSYQVKDKTAKNTRSYSEMENDMEQYLRRFYEPHNRQLAVILGNEWNNVWVDVRTIK